MLCNCHIIDEVCHPLLNLEINYLSHTIFRHIVQVYNFSRPHKVTIQILYVDLFQQGKTILDFKSYK